MTDTKRQSIVNAIDARLKAILVASPAVYNLNLGLSVHEWRSTPLDDAELPAIIYRDQDEIIAVTVGKHEHRMLLEIELVLSGATVPAIMRKGIADVVKAVGVDVTFGGLAEDTEFEGSESISVIQNERRIAGVVLRFIITYLTNPFDPYT
jgi:hypothetical protein